jgi:hypothetical protein
LVNVLAYTGPKQPPVRAAVWSPAMVRDQNVFIAVYLGELILCT